MKNLSHWLALAVVVALGIVSIVLWTTDKSDIVSLTTEKSKISTVAAQTTTDTSLWITAGTFRFYKDTGTDMNTYMGQAGNEWTSIDIGTYEASLSAVSANSAENHRFTVADMKGDPFTVTIQSSDLTSWSGDTISRSNVWYAGGPRRGTGVALSAAPTWAADIGTAPVTFVAKTERGVLMMAQDLEVVVNIPAFQAPGAYEGTITFTY